MKGRILARVSKGALNETGSARYSVDEGCSFCASKFKVVPRNAVSSF